MGFLFGGKNKGVVGAAVSINKKTRNNNKAQQNAKQQQQPVSIEFKTTWASETSIVSSECEGEFLGGTTGGSNDFLVDVDSLVEIIVDDLPKGIPKYYGSDQSHDVGLQPRHNQKKKAKGIPNMVAFGGGPTDESEEEDMISVISSLSKTSLTSVHAPKTTKPKPKPKPKQQLAKMRQDAPKQHLFKIPPTPKQNQPTKSKTKNNLLKYQLASPSPGYFRYVAKGTEDNNDKSIYST